jgi:alpha-tubulin suppressor-like RCC1 family protein
VIDVPAGLTNVVKISGASHADHCLALRGDGSVAAWGQETAPGSVLEPPAGLTDITMASTGTLHGLALRSDGTVTAWGNDDFGQRTVPVDLTGVVEIAAGNWHSLALRADGSITGWGSNFASQINVFPSAAPIEEIQAGRDFSIAKLADGSVVGWGLNPFGTTTPPLGLTNVAQIAAGDFHVLARRTDGTVVGWGENGYGQTTTSGLDPSDPVIDVSAGFSTSMAIHDSGDITVWGYGALYSELLDVPPSAQFGPLQGSIGEEHCVVRKMDGFVTAWGPFAPSVVRTPPAGLRDVTQVDAGVEHTLALRQNGSVVAWGTNVSGCCVVPPGLSNVTKVAAGWDSSFALFTDESGVGRVIAWGQGAGNMPPNIVLASDLAASETHCIVIREGDCNDDGIIDAYAVEDGLDFDLNVNGIADACDITFGWEEDCDMDGIIDSHEQSLNLVASADSGTLPRIGFGHSQQWLYASPSLSLDDPVLTVQVYGDFSAPGETLTVTLNGRFVGTLFTSGSDKNDCRRLISRSITLPRAFYNECIAAPGGASDAWFDFSTPVAVNADQCASSSWVRAQITYTAAVLGDCNANSLLDACEVVLDPSLDGNADGVIDACQGMGVVFLCPGDLDASGSVDPGDLSLLLLNFGLAMPGDPNDIDGSGIIDNADIGFMLLFFGPCG